MRLTSEEIEARKYAWTYGVIAPWYLKKPQLETFKLLKNSRFPFNEQSRRTGKTTTNLVHVLEQLRRNESWVWRWCEPWKYQAREIVMPEIDIIQTHCPEKLKFKFYKTDSFYEGPNGSRLYLRGVNEDRGESSRGAFAHGITCDEYGSWKEPDYIVNEVLLPQLLSTNGQLIKASTPPRDLGHLYYEEKEKAFRENRFISKPIWDFEGHLYTREQILGMCEAVGGENSPAWRREFLCEPVSDPDMLVVPEFSEKNIVENDYPRPEFPIFYVGGDSGIDDNTALLFGWYDFLKNELVVEEEFVQSGLTSKQIVDVAKSIELRLWPDKTPQKRVYDADKQLIYDIWVDHGYHIQAPKKDDKLAAIHELRMEVGSLRIKIKRHCKHLIQQMKVGLWKDERHTDFQRSEGLGHLDAIAALIYLNRSIDRNFNPVPRHHGLSKFTHHINDSSARLGKTEQTIKDVFGGKSRRFT
jgi:hypothetical protein